MSEKESQEKKDKRGFFVARLDMKEGGQGQAEWYANEAEYRAHQANLEQQINNQATEFKDEADPFVKSLEAGVNDPDTISKAREDVGLETGLVQINTDADELVAAAEAQMRRKPDSILLNGTQTSPEMVTDVQLRHEIHMHDLTSNRRIDKLVVKLSKSEDTLDKRGYDLAVEIACKEYPRVIYRAVEAGEIKLTPTQFDKLEDGIKSDPSDYEKSFIIESLETIPWPDANATNILKVGLRRNPELVQSVINKIRTGNNPRREEILSIANELMSK